MTLCKACLLQPRSARLLVMLIPSSVQCSHQRCLMVMVAEVLPDFSQAEHSMSEGESVICRGLGQSEYGKSSCRC